MGLFKKSSDISTAVTKTTADKTETPTNVPTKDGATTTTTGGSGNFLDIIAGILGGSSTSTVGSKRSNTGSGDPVSSIVSSVSNVASAWLNGDANKQVAKLTVEANQLMAEAEASKADQALYEALQAKAETKTNEATQLANKAKSDNTTNWLTVASVLLLAFGILYLVFKAVFGWTRSPTNQTKVQNGSI